MSTATATLTIGRDTYAAHARLQAPGQLPAWAWLLATSLVMAGYALTAFEADRVPVMALQKPALSLWTILAFALALETLRRARRAGRAA